MFSLTHETIDAQALRRELEADGAGAFVCFEGWVRKSNAGRDVIALEFEASPEIASKEFARIATEVKEQFGTIALTCSHRTGRLEIGDMAVWIGVTTAHRGEAFDACRYVIDELKQRLPIWKKEFYTDGASEWINHP